MPQAACGRGLSLAPPRRPPHGSPDLPAAHVIRPQRRHLGAPDEEGKSGGKRGKRAGREVGEDEGEGTAGLLAGQRRLAEAAAAARPQVPRPGAAPPPAGSAAAGHVRSTLRPLPAPASSFAGGHRPVLATCPKFRVLFQCSAPPTARPAETPGLLCRGGWGETCRSPHTVTSMVSRAGLLGVRCFLPLCRCETA